MNTRPGKQPSDEKAKLATSQSPARKKANRMRTTPKQIIELIAAFAALLTAIATLAQAFR